jgi:DNA primase
MTRRFSAQELSFLRNKIPINHVIETMLSVATGNDNGKLSFACPVCRAVNTAINTNHNLARCFDCRQNFNPIEFVMHQLHLSFVDSVKWLKRYNRPPASEKATLHAMMRSSSMISDTCSKAVRRWKCSLHCWPIATNAAA